MGGLGWVGFIFFFFEEEEEEEESHPVIKLGGGGELTGKLFVRILSIQICYVYDLFAELKPNGSRPSRSFPFLVSFPFPHYHPPNPPPPSSNLLTISSTALFSSASPLRAFRIPSIPGTEL